MASAQRRRISANHAAGDVFQTAVRFRQCGQYAGESRSSARWSGRSQRSQYQCPLGLWLARVDMGIL